MRITKLLATTGVLALVLPVSVATADETGESGSLADLVQTAPSVGMVQGTYESLFDADRRVTVMVELKDDPVAVVEANSGDQVSEAKAEEIQADLKQDQAVVAAVVEAKGGSVESQMQSAYNGMRVTIKASELPALLEAPGVKAVHDIAQHERENVNGVPYIGTPEVWGGARTGTPYTGEGVKIAVIDSGIDYTHATFGGPGTAEAYQEQSAPGATPNSAWYGPNAPSVKGGVDLVGDDYNGNNSPVPDDNPIDCVKNAHGTHVAGTIAGLGVNTDGTTYTGEYNQDTYNNQQFRVGPGVAPKAELYAVRVFGCQGSTNVTTEAIDWAVKNKMDVINMSLGSAYGMANEPSSVAAANAAAKGITVVASAGNAGTRPYLVGSPSVGAGVISVAANDPAKAFPGATLDIEGTAISAINANSAELPASAPIHVLKDAAGSVALGCAAEDYKDIPQGSIVVTKRGSCARVDRAIFGQKAGAAGVVMINTDDTLPGYEGKILQSPTTGEAYDVTIPFLGVKSSDEAALTAAEGKTVNLASGQVDNPNFGAYGSFSSAGPRSGDSALRPSLTAPGVLIASAAVGTGNEASIKSGTSMAAPHASGVAALARQAHPTWTGQEISAVLVSTADFDKVAGYKVPRGGGLVDPGDATVTNVFAYGDATEINGATVRDAVVSFGLAEFNAAHEDTRTVTLVNKGASEVTFTGAVIPSSASLKADVSLSSGSVTVPAGGTTEVQVTIKVNPSDVPTSLLADGDPGFYEISGNLQFTGSDSQTLNVPYLMVPRVQAEVAGTAHATGADASEITFTNADGGIKARGDVFALGLTDPDDVDDATDLTGMDLASVGAATFERNGETYLAFAVNNHSKFSNAAANTYEVVLDTDHDGSPEFSVGSIDVGSLQEGRANGVAGTFVYKFDTRDVTVTSLAVAPTDSSTVIVTVKASDVGVTGKFSYTAVASGRGGSSVDRTDGWAQYDPTNRPFNDGATFEVAPSETVKVPVSINSAAYADQGTKGWMAVVFDNEKGVAEALTGDLPGDPAPTDSPTPDPTGSPTATPDPTDSPTPDPADPSPTVTPTSVTSPTGRPSPVPVQPGLPKTGNRA
ncbi:MAG: S8 family serine peptidase [Propionibacteriaceae bacterium]|nr:S8 family serine peptidase [Propionibacteriaceae bacterium]